MSSHFRMAEKRSADMNDGESVEKLPKKKFYRQRAHSNPIADHCFDYPVSPDKVRPTSFPVFTITPCMFQHSWAEFFPDHPGGMVEFADIGCGYGGLLVQLSPMFPNTLMIGMRSPVLFPLCIP